MRSGTALTLLGLCAVAFQGAAATGWGGQDSYNVPSNTANECTIYENRGFNWTDLNEGRVGKYQDYEFRGWSCSKAGSERRNLEGKTFNSKKITAVIKRDEFSNEISCDKEFSIRELDISTDHDIPLEFHYGMADGSTCKHTSTCKSSLRAIPNTQCGGAKTVKIRIPKSEGKKECTVNIHNIKFECNTKTIEAPTGRLPSFTPGPRPWLNNGTNPIGPTCSGHGIPGPEETKIPTIAIPVPTSAVPDTLPKCLNTWLFIAESCASNADISCFCPNARFVEKVAECLTSRAKDADEASRSVEYFVGLCRKYIPENPVIASIIPDTATFPALPTNVPVQTITRTLTVVVPCTPTTISEGVSSGSVVSSTTEYSTQTFTVPDLTLINTATGAGLYYPTPVSEHLDVPVSTSAPFIDVHTTRIPGVALPTGSTPAEITNGIPEVAIPSVVPANGIPTNGIPGLPIEVPTNGVLAIPSGIPTIGVPAIPIPTNGVPAIPIGVPAYPVLANSTNIPAYPVPANSTAYSIPSNSTTYRTPSNSTNSTATPAAHKPAYQTFTPGPQNWGSNGTNPAAAGPTGTAPAPAPPIGTGTNPRPTPKAQTPGSNTLPTDIPSEPESETISSHSNDIFTGAASSVSAGAFTMFAVAVVAVVFRL